ncbi:hypothetical protein JQ557_15525 [Bradyrhizobium sp. U87765 SZCCT0131]|nr:hypothetical protein [Bradyrhizobium sp. U87765 SZCCT0131]MBR1262064.1 hypothetical protein [Bradyrhizobium sp. U87765 SZCCT0134]MBR1306083.1 hypothetical protein [Bradyrhizobium sp. U87765 SZCCT0110]MBR1317846.1 hypothetical protein [Bradyrhizobium sp. U87765 SZCCT0109]MBR1351548.1 hypothetical protein [Bradyrhizobium sp. U87765 SZCCT0048]
MRTFIGMILGCLLTIAVVYIHDTMATSTVANGGAIATQARIVNWDVASSEWNRMTDRIRTAWARLTADVG